MASVSSFSAARPVLSAQTEKGLVHLDKPTIPAASEPPIVFLRRMSHSSRLMPFVDIF